MAAQLASVCRFPLVYPSGRVYLDMKHALHRGGASDLNLYSVPLNAGGTIGYAPPRSAASMLHMGLVVSSCCDSGALQFWRFSTLHPRHRLGTGVVTQDEQFTYAEQFVPCKIYIDPWSRGIGVLGEHGVVKNLSRKAYFSLTGEVPDSQQVFHRPLGLWHRRARPGWGRH